MSHDLEHLLRASLSADSPDWLDRLVSDRVNAEVEQQTAAEAAAQARRASAQAALAALQRGSERLRRLAQGLLPSGDASEEPHVLDDPNGA